MRARAIHRPRLGEHTVEGLLPLRLSSISIAPCVLRLALVALQCLAESLDRVLDRRVIQLESVDELVGTHVGVPGRCENARMQRRPWNDWWRSFVDASRLRHVPVQRESRQPVRIPRRVVPERRSQYVSHLELTYSEQVVPPLGGAFVPALRRDTTATPACAATLDTKERAASTVVPSPPPSATTTS